jgi:hypothetical protein
MINGAHAIIYSKSAEADRAFLADVLGLPSVDVGGGWLIFGLPPSEVAVHPTDEGEGGRHELYLMCENIDVFVTAMAAKGIACSDVSNQGWGMLSNVTLPGGSQLGVYQPRHARPPVFGGERRPKPIASTSAKKPAAKSAAKRSVAKKPATKATAMKAKPAKSKKR